MSEQFDIGKMGWEASGLVVDAARVMQKVEDARLAWESLNKKQILPHEFLELLLNNYLKDFTQEAQRNAGYYQHFVND